MVADGPHSENRYAYIIERDRPIADPVAAPKQVVVKKQAVQVLRMHTIGQPGRICIPCHQIT